MPVLSDHDRLARIQANNFEWLRPDWFLRLEKLYDGACAVLKLSPQELSANGGISTSTAEQFLKEAAALDPHKELEKVSKAGGAILFLGEENYPQSLAETSDPPLLLYVRGKADFTRTAVGIVGTRKPTPYGKRVAARLARDIASAGAVIVSGLARGIDSVAHAAALETETPTWAVIGTGIGRCYPAENADLARAIIERGGAVISEYNFDKGPLQHHFPRRNRIVSGLSRAVAVVEGAAASGALITAKLALEQGREVLAVPGPVDSPQSEGPNMLIKEGAGVLRNATDLLEALPLEYRFGLAGQDKDPEGFLAPPPAPQGMSDDERTVLELLGTAGATLDAVVEKTGWDVPRAATALFELETKTVVTCLSGVYSRKL
jgi:DNA processing protein